MKDIWPRLSRVQQFALADETKERYRSRLLEHDNVVSVGCGRRQRSGEFHDEPVVHVTVSRKKAPNQLGTSLLPRFIPTWWTDESGKRSRAYVPIDVLTDTGPGEIQSVQCGATQVHAKYNGMTTQGSCCCILKINSNPGKFYWLSCAHVFALMDRQGRPDYSRWQFHEVHVPGLGRLGILDGISLFPRMDGSAPSGPNPMARTDSAVVDIDDITQFSHFICRQPLTKFQGVLTGPLDYLSAKFLVTPNGFIVVDKMPLRKGSKEVTGYFGSRKSLTFPNVIISKTLGDVSKGGHSGSPLISDDFKLIGMHFGGNPNIGESYAFPISDIFESLDFDASNVEVYFTFGA